MHHFYNEVDDSFLIYFPGKKRLHFYERFSEYAASPSSPPMFGVPLSSAPVALAISPLPSFRAFCVACGGSTRLYVYSAAFCTFFPFHVRLPAGVTALAFAHFGLQLALVSGAGLHVLDLPSERLERIPLRLGSVERAEFSRDDRFLLLVGYAGGAVARAEDWHVRRVGRRWRSACWTSQPGMLLALQRGDSAKIESFHVAENGDVEAVGVVETREKWERLHWSAATGSVWVERRARALRLLPFERYGKLNMKEEEDFQFDFDAEETARVSFLIDREGVLNLVES